ncbi:MAG: hypothetical protein U5O15_06060 [Candidatus Krumholzibacteriota bacterium]|nr:hypothetical protein [Candidatus Krumholzibacteriota bacterium]
MKLERFSDFGGRYLLVAVFAVCVSVCSRSASAYIIRTTRSESMGGTRESFNNDASVIFLNPAAVSNIDVPLFYFDYTGNHISGMKGAFVYPLKEMEMGFSFYRRRNKLNEAAESVAAGISKKLFSGTPSTYLEIGATLRIDRFIFDIYSGCSSCNETRVSDSDITGDIGIIIRPVPPVSFRYTAAGLRERNKLDYDSDVLSERGSWFGATLYLKEKLLVSWEGEYRGSHLINHYGFCLETGAPLELMAGFSEGFISGGVRLRWNFIRSSVAFFRNNKGNIQGRVSLELEPGRFPATFFK